MCDYSLHGLDNRLAEEGEVLIVHRFYTGSKGLTSPDYLKPSEQPTGLRGVLKRMFAAQPKVCAVCVPDGATLLLRGISQALAQAHGLSTTEVVTFRQLSTNDRTYRDAVEFENGEKVRLQDLDEGQSVAVLALSSETVGIRERTFIAAGSAVRLDMETNRLMESRASRRLTKRCARIVPVFPAQAWLGSTGQG